MEEKRIQGIRAFTNDLIAQTTESLGVSHDTAFLLLDHFHWNQKELLSKWESEKDEILKSVHINVGSEAVPSIDSSLHCEDIGLGECPFCSRQRKLYRLYCGHKGCTECLGDQIRNSIKKHVIPVCTQEGCNSEILAHDVDKILPHSNTAKNYKFWRWNKSFDESNLLVGHCQNPLCQNLLVVEAHADCNSCRCPKCDFVTCMKCLNPAHAPLCCCNKSVEFTTNIPNEMQKLEKEEDDWYRREARYIEYRFQNIKDLKNEFDVNLRALTRKQNEEQEEILQELKNLDLFVAQINSQIAEAEEKLKESVQKKKPAENIEELNKELNALNEEIVHYNDFKVQLEEENKARKELRMKELDFLKTQNQLFTKACENRDKYDTYIQQYKENLEKFAEEKSKQIQNDDDYIRERTVKCPSCGIRFYKTCGCNEITCPCGYEFCTICGEPWITHKDGFYQCPNATEVKPIDYEDGSDYKFYPLPIDIEKRAQFYAWKRFHGPFLHEKERYDEIYKKFLQGKDRQVGKKEKFTDDHLCPLNKIVKRLETDGNEDAKATALRFVSNAIFAQSVVMWGYGANFFSKFNEFTEQYTEKLQSLHKKNDEFIELLSDPLKHTSDELGQKLIELKDEVDSVLKNKF